MKQSMPESVDEDIPAQPEAVRPKLEQVRAAIRRAVPAAVEGIAYRMPGYKQHEKPMLYFAGDDLDAAACQARIERVSLTTSDLPALCRAEIRRLRRQRS